jgi:hypothetical protein
METNNMSDFEAEDFAAVVFMTYSPQGDGNFRLYALPASPQ